MMNNNDKNHPLFDLWEDLNPGGPTPDNLLSRIVEAEVDYEDEFFDPDEFE